MPAWRAVLPGDPSVGTPARSGTDGATVVESVNLQILPPMNRKTFTLALCFLILTLVWLGYNIYELLRCCCSCHIFTAAVAVAVTVAAVCIVCHEFRKKRRVHLDKANRHQIP